MKMVLKPWLWICTFLLFSLYGPGFAQKKKKDKAVTSAPTWINELPMSKGSLYAVGMVNRYFDKKAGEEAAGQAARLELAQTIKVSVKSITSSYSGTAGGSFVSSLEKSIDEDVMTAVQNAKVLETWVDPEGLTYALAELPLAGSVGAIQKKVIAEAKKEATDKKDFKKIEKLEVSLDGLKDPKSYVRKDKPEWVSALPEEEDAIYALGVAEGYYFYVNGREAAKDKARAELGRTIQTEVQSVLTDWYEVNTGSSGYQIDQNYLEEISKSVSDATLSGSQVVETWFDRSPKWHYA
ncbi:MAG: LPP20 family lipoprotein, partial [Bacteroidetes bacterium]|nr:LPP20 family lipoprotein [Bacteroidota bacterium]